MEALTTFAVLISAAAISIPMALALTWLSVRSLLRVIGVQSRPSRPRFKGAAQARPGRSERVPLQHSASQAA